MARTVIMLYGPTASGKTALSIHVANALNGVLINADSRQIYTQIPVLSAMPTAQEFAAAEHRLFSFVDPSEEFSVERYRSLAIAEIEKVWAQGKLPILVGGTGFYLKVLEEGLSPVPHVPRAVADELYAQIKRAGLTSLVDELKQGDPELAQTLDTSNPARVVRALAVLRHTGKPLSFYQAQPKQGGLDATFVKIAIARPRDEIYARVHNRFDDMIAAGAVHEIEALKKRNLPLHLPALTACGVPEFYAYFNGDISHQEAAQKMRQHTRNYVKRQLTWLRHHYGADMVLDGSEPIDNIIQTIKEKLNATA